MKSVIIFASGSGTNAENIIQCLHQKRLLVTRIYCNNSQAGIIEKAERLHIPICMISKADWKERNDSNLIVLAGFLWKIPEYLINQFPDKIINLHPSLLPKYGGKGMYGLNVHKAVIENKELTTGITIHWVNAEYDEGGILFQAEMYVSPSKTPEDLAERIHKLEQAHFQDVIRQVLHC
jgi:phosphoribosylglycinamide formyltransferase 1